MKSIKIILCILLFAGSIGSVLAVWDIIQQIEPDYLLEWSVIGSTLFLFILYFLMVEKNKVAEN